MVFTQEQIKIIQENRPDLRFQRLPTLDDIVFDFLRKFDIVLTKKNKRFASNDIYNMNNFTKSLNIIRSNTSIHEETGLDSAEWNYWKKWALEHQDFEEFKILKIKSNQMFNKKILDKLNSEEVVEEFNKYFNNSNLFKILKREYLTSIVFIFVLFICFLLIYKIINQRNIFNLENKNISFNNSLISKFKNA
tara:strand:- start:1111 stop:1686 length:576 start_codon:yes stop_codon:yes gene_type:complete